MTHKQIMNRLARARMEIDAAATALAEEEYGKYSGTIEREIKEAKARVTALEARVQVLEARSAIVR